MSSSTSFFLFSLRPDCLLFLVVPQQAAVDKKSGSRDRRVQRLVPAVILRKCLLDVILGRASQLALLRNDIGSIKKQFVAANLTPTNTEATKFWPL
jgi:hypothetical protein